MAGATTEIIKRVKISYAGSRQRSKTWNAPNGHTIKEGGVNKSQIVEKKGAHITYDIVRNESESGEGRCPGCFGKELKGDSLQIIYKGDEKKSQANGYFDVTVLPRESKSTAILVPNTPTKSVLKESPGASTPDTVTSSSDDGNLTSNEGRLSVKFDPSLEPKDSFVAPPSFPDISDFESDEDTSLDNDVSWPPRGGGLTIVEDPYWKKNTPMFNFLLYVFIYMGLSFFVVYAAIHQIYQNGSEFNDSNDTPALPGDEPPVSLVGQIWSIARLGTSTSEILSILGVTDSSWW